MAAINRAYTSEYSTLRQAYQPGQWAYPAPETKPAAPKVKRTRQRPELETKAPQAGTAVITHKMLRRAVLLLIFAGAVLISTISMYCFLVARSILALGEAGNFPAAIKTTAEYFPKKDRAFATSIFNAGASI